MNTQLCKKFLDSQCFVVFLEMFDTPDLLKFNLVSTLFYDDKIPRFMQMNSLKYQVSAMLKACPKELEPEL